MATLSVVIITLNEAANLPRTLESVRWANEVIVLDSGSIDTTREIAESFGAKVFVEEWKGFAAQKNSALAKAGCDWVLSLDADEAVSSELTASIRRELAAGGKSRGYFIARRNFFLGRWLRHGGFYPDRKLRLFRRGAAQFEDRPVHEDARLLPSPETATTAANLEGDLLHYAYPSLAAYIEHMNRYSSLGANQVAARGRSGFSVVNILLRPAATFFYNYVLRGGFLDGREGLLLHLYHAVYVSWKYAKAWELGRGHRS